MDNLCPKYDEEYEKVLKSDAVQAEEQRNKVFEYCPYFDCNNHTPLGSLVFWGPFFLSHARYLGVVHGICQAVIG